jgi:hypothetical protein
LEIISMARNHVNGFRPGDPMKDRNRIKGPKGEWLHVTLLQVKERDPQTGRATECRIRYDDEEIGLAGVKGPNGGTPEFFMVWMSGTQLHGKPMNGEPAPALPTTAETLTLQRDLLEAAKASVDATRQELGDLVELEGFLKEIERRLAAMRAP